MTALEFDDKWWKNTVVYNVYLPSFKDGNGDGIGDFRGLTSKLKYFTFLQVKTLMLSPFFPSPMYDNGYDITDYCSIDPRYGTMDDFDQFMEGAKAQGLNIIIDLPINHTSYRHKWFVQSVKQHHPYTDYYVWAEPKFTESDALPPNNWLSVFGGSAWEWNRDRDQFYLHQFLSEQPDLNLRNPHVRQEIKEIFIFWLQKGVDGFRIDAASHLFEDKNFQNEPYLQKTKAKPDEYEYLDHIHTKGHPENLDILQEWRDFLTVCSVKSGKYKLLLAEATEELPEQMRYYGDNAKPIADVPFNFALTKLHLPFTPTDLKDAIMNWMNAMPMGKTPNWVVGNHDISRLASRVGQSLVTGFEMVALLLPGVIFWYYGDELGMEDVEMNVNSMKDTFALRTKPENSRDPCRTPMQWNSKAACFTTNSTPWLPLSQNYRTVNMEVEKRSPVSPLQIFKKLMVLRMESSIQEGLIEFPFIDDSIFSMVRLERHSKGFLVALNMGILPCTVDFVKASNKFPAIGYVELSNNPYLNGVPQPEKLLGSYEENTTVIWDEEKGHWKFRLNKVYLTPNEALVLSF